MILYQLAQWMEERSSLQRALRQGGAESMELRGRMHEVEQRLQEQAERWRASFASVAAAPIPYEAPHLDPDALL